MTGGADMAARRGAGAAPPLRGSVARSSAARCACGEVRGGVRVRPHRLLFAYMSTPCPVARSCTHSPRNMSPFA